MKKNEVVINQNFPKLDKERERECEHALKVTFLFNKALHMSSNITQHETHTGTGRARKGEKQTFSNLPTRLAQSGIQPLYGRQPSVWAICPLCPLTFQNPARSVAASSQCCGGWFSCFGYGFILQGCSSNANFHISWVQSEFSLNISGSKEVIF